MRAVRILSILIAEDLRLGSNVNFIYPHWASASLTAGFCAFRHNGQRLRIVTWSLCKENNRCRFANCCMLEEKVRETYYLFICVLFYECDGVIRSNKLKYMYLIHLVKHSNLFYCSPE